MTRDEALRTAGRMRCAFAEAGYPDVVIEIEEHTADRSQMAPVVWGWHPAEVVWTAYLVSGAPGLRCWPCWNSAHRGETEHTHGCEHDPWTSERPRLERAR